MSRKIIGVTVGTSISPEALKEKLGIGENPDITGLVERAEAAATSANTAMTTTNIYRSNAKTSETNAANSATRAEEAATRAEEAAANAGNGSGSPVGDQNAVLFTEQELTAEQQIQARENIGIEDLLTEEITGASGINLNDGVYEIGRFSTSGTEYDNEGNFAFRNVNYLPVEGGRTIVVYFEAAEWNGNRINWGVELVQYDSSGAVIENKRHYIENYLNNSKSSFTLDANAALIRIHYNRNGELVFEDMTAPKIAIYYLEDAVQEFVEYGAGAETVLMVRKDRVQGLVALAGKKIIYDGDSICAGSAANAGGGYARIIADQTGSTFVNFAQGGGHLCSGVADRHCVADNLPNLPTDGDIYCFQGGINDYWGNAVLGTYTPGDYTGAVDATTVCGALETIFRYALTNFPGKPVCFVIPHKIQNTAYQTNSAGNTFKDYRDAMAGICQKYSVPFYDAFSESGLNGWNDAQNSLYLTGNENGTPDGCHPNEEGYRRFYVNQLIDLFESGRSSGSAEKGEPGKDGDDYVLTLADKTEIAEMAAGLVEVPESSGGGIAVTGAKVGQTVKISAVDGNGVPTAWEPTDFPSGGGGSEWRLIASIVTEEEVQEIVVSEDMDGNPISCNEVYVYFYGRPVKNDDGSDSTGVGIVFLPNGYWSSGTYASSAGLTSSWNNHVGFHCLRQCGIMLTEATVYPTSNQYKQQMIFNKEPNRDYIYLIKMRSDKNWQVGAEIKIIGR